MPVKTESLTKKELTDIIFDTTYAMDLDDGDNAKFYDFLKLKYIALFEGEENYAYDDGVGPKHPYTPNNGLRMHHVFLVNIKGKSYRMKKFNKLKEEKMT